MARSFQSIDAAKQTLTNLQQTTAIQQLPPGFIAGFKMTLGTDLRVTIGDGIANVQGSQVQWKSGYLTSDMWAQQQVGGATGRYFYIYLQPTGDIRVDLTAPSFDPTYFQYILPGYGYRGIGKLFVDKNDNIVFVQNTIDLQTIFADLITYGAGILSMPNLNPLAEDTGLYIDANGNIFGRYYDGAVWQNGYKISIADNVAQFPKIEGPDKVSIDAGTASARLSTDYDAGTASARNAADVDALYASDNAFALNGQVQGNGQTLYDVSIHGTDDKNRTYSFGKNGGIKIVDAASNIIHDVPDSALLSGYYAMGHLYMTKQSTAAYTLLSSTGNTGPYAPGSTCTIVTDGISNIKGVRVKIVMSDSGGTTGPWSYFAMLRPHGSAWTYATNDQTPMIAAGITSAGTGTGNAVMVMDVPVDSSGQFDYQLYISPYGGTSCNYYIYQIGIWV